MNWKAPLYWTVAASATTLSLGTSAQSTVNLYGLIEVSGNYAKFGRTATRSPSHLYTLSSDSSRLGFRGSEDLGSGLRAYFKLETGVSFDTATQTSAAQFWNRESYVGLSDSRFGAVQLGSQFTPEVWTSGKVDPFGRFGLGAIVGLLQGAPRAWSGSYTNALQYMTPTLAGFQGRLMIAPGEGAATGRSYGGSLEYTSTRLYLTLNYDEPKVAAASVGLTGPVVWSKTISAGGTYDFGVVKLAGWYQQNRIEKLSNVNGYLAGITVPVGLGEIRATYAHRSQTNADASQSAIGYFYFLSKRTWLFTQLGRMNSSGTAAFGLGPARTEEAATRQLAGGRHVTGLQIGMRHSF